MGHEHIHGHHSHEHNHSHSHEHTHDGHTHTHEHDHAHEHEHEHPHTHDHLHGADHHHDHHHHDHHHEHSATPMDQLCALMNYMVNHNAAHAGELADLAEQLKGVGKDAACEKVLSAVAEFKKGNHMLAEVLKELAE